MKDLRNMTDHEREQYFTCDVPRWAYFVTFFGGVAVGFWIVAPLVAGVIGKVMEIF